VRAAACAGRARVDDVGMTIDLTGPYPTLEWKCDHCGRTDDLYRLIGTVVSLCRGCFAHKHG
jgi:hypothetical protein